MHNLNAINYFKQPPRFKDLAYILPPVLVVSQGLQLLLRFAWCPTHYGLSSGIASGLCIFASQPCLLMNREPHLHSLVTPMFADGEPHFHALVIVKHMSTMSPYLMP